MIITAQRIADHLGIPLSTFRWRYRQGWYPSVHRVKGVLMMDERCKP